MKAIGIYRIIVGTTLGVLVSFVSACTPPVPTPAELPTSTDAATENSPQAPTLPPSWTPGVAATVTPFSDGGNTEPTATPLIVQVTREGVQTLPPTWTPFRAPTVTPQPRPAFATFTPVPPTPEPAISPTRNLAEGPLAVQPNETYDDPECKRFSIATNLYEYKAPGTAITVGWTNIPADYYDLWVRNPELRYTYREQVPVRAGEPTIYFTIPGNTFLGLGRFTWEVYPVRNAYRMCPTVSGTIFISRQY